MSLRRSLLLPGAAALFGASASLLPLVAQQPAPASQTATPARTAGGRQMSVADLLAWKAIRNPTLSSDGKWFAYVLAPNEGDATVVLRATADSGKEQRFAIGELPAPAAGAFGPAAGPAPLTVSGDGRWAAFTIYPAQREARRLRQQRRPSYNKVAIVNLATGEKKEFDHIRRFAFNGDKPGWLAMQGYPPEPPAATPGAAPAGPGAGAAARSETSDLVLYNLSSGEVIDVGNVAEFAFDESGDRLAYTVETRDQVGNGVQLRDMRTDVVRSLDNASALYRRLTWADSGVALAVLRGVADTVARDTTYAVVTFTGFQANGKESLTPRKVAFLARDHADFPAGMRVSPDRAPSFSDDLGAVFFGIREANKPAPRGPLMAGREGAGAGRPGGAPIVQAGAPGAGGTLNQPRADQDDETPTLVLWHWKDPRLQSQQLVQESQDKTFAYLTEYRFAENKVIRLADDVTRQVSLAPHEQYAVGTDTRAYDQAASYSGRRYADVYAIDARTGARTLALKKSASPLTLPSPDGRQVLYWGDDAHWHVLDLATSQTRDISAGVPAQFGNTEDDHNNLVLPPNQPMGWAKDGSAVLLSDGWDVWKVSTRGAPAVNLTGNGKATKVRYQRLYAFEAPGAGGRGGRRAGGAGLERGVDLSKPLYFGTYGEWTKKEGLARVEPGKAGATPLVVGDAKYDFVKAKDANVFAFTRQTFVEFPDWYVAAPAADRSDAVGAALAAARRITDANPQQKEFAWSSGARLISYVSDKGDTLQGALYLPANYEPGKRYPLLVTIYEKRSQGLHQYTPPSATRTPDPSIYTSRGYAVLDPDIVYKVNDPGMSAVWCVVPAVKAAVATGIVDSARVGLWGHSWGGYQTAFLVTQTNVFKAAIAGAPLTDMVSMYSSIYWNSGGTNQAIFESSQGRFKGNFTDNYDAYIRNSPVFHARNVRTPLVILHDDKDGAVDFNQGITYFNTLRQLGKEVILLEYMGENHGLARPVNQKDYAVRQREWFDHFLLGAPAPDWMTTGIPRLKMEEHLKERKALVTPAPDVVP